jgi:hypothetical protein
MLPWNWSHYLGWPAHFEIQIPVYFHGWSASFFRKKIVYFCGRPALSKFLKLLYFHGRHAHFQKIIYSFGRPPLFKIQKLVYFMSDLLFLRFKNLLDFIEDFSKWFKKIYAMLWGYMTCMYPYLDWNIGPSFLCSTVIRCLCLLSKAFSIFLIHWLIRVYHMPILYSNASVVPILGYLQWLLLSLFIKPDYAPKCGVAWFIIKEFEIIILLLWFSQELSSNRLCASCQQSSKGFLVLASS